MSQSQRIARSTALRADFFIKEQRKARSDRAAATPAKPSERISGSSKNKPGSASSGRGSIELSSAVAESLKQKASDHNEAMKDREKWRKTTSSTLEAVYRRGAGAFSTSHRPGMTRGQWSMGRVNAFLRILSSGKPSNSRYINDNDLLHDDHPWKKRGQK